MVSMKEFIFACILQGAVVATLIMGFCLFLVDELGRFSDLCCLADVYPFEYRLIFIGFDLDTSLLYKAFRQH